MVQYLDNTIYTNYALYKICRNIVEDIEDFHFLKVKVGSGDSTLDANKEELSLTLYSLDVMYTEYKDGVLTIRCELPPELADVPITEIGLFDTINGIEHLFSYSKVNVVKPADLGYELTIVLNLGPRTIDFPGINEYYIPQYEYATRDLLDDFTSMLLFVDTNLERIIRSNAGVIGYNIPNRVYQRQRQINAMLRNIIDSNIYYSLYNSYDGEISSMYFLQEPNYLSYDIINYADSSSWLDVSYGLWEANTDNITLHNGPCTVWFNAKLSDLDKESTIINKRNDSDLYISINVEKNEETYLITSDGVEHKAEFNELVFTFYGLTSVYKVKYILDMNNIGKYIGKYTPYAFTFNGDFTAPDLHVYIDEEEPEEFIIPTGEAPIEEQAGINDEMTDERKERLLTLKTEELKSRMYGKCIIPYDVTALVDMPDNSYIPIKNYLMNYNTGKKESYDNALGIKSIVSLKRQANKYELALLNNILNIVEY